MGGEPGAEDESGGLDDSEGFKCISWTEKVLMNLEWLE